VTVKSAFQVHASDASFTVLRQPLVCSTDNRVPCQSATSEYSPTLPGSDSAPKSVVGVSHRVFHSRLKTHLFSRSFPP